MDCSPPDSSIHGIFQARVLEWVAIPSPGDLSDPGIKPRSPAMQAAALPSEPPGEALLTTNPHKILYIYKMSFDLLFLDYL